MTKGAIKCDVCAKTIKKEDRRMQVGEQTLCRACYLKEWRALKSTNDVDDHHNDANQKENIDVPPKKIQLSYRRHPFSKERLVSPGVICMQPDFFTIFLQIGNNDLRMFVTCSIIQFVLPPRTRRNMIRLIFSL